MENKNNQLKVILGITICIKQLKLRLLSNPGKVRHPEAISHHNLCVKDFTKHRYL